MMRAAALTSARLQRVLGVLADGRPHTTRDIVRKGRVMAVNACIAELRTHGAEITCVQMPNPSGGGRRWIYTMTKSPNAPVVKA